ncbi:hypothetical protein [uncultured Holdemanella sp.]|uniref:hypothetical protein n=1 Tax=uncultured Holdemanella sp. TaxID=1763549 RepID=UPI0025FE0BEB|nr:hypothetical protein [uncultured Holdemanella sp.]
MNDKSKDLLKKMCFILKIVRWVCLISVVLLIGLSLFYTFNKDVYNTLFGSIRIDFLQLIFKDDTALHKDSMSMWLPLIFLITAILVFIVYKSIQTIESICTITMDHTPFDVRVANHIKNLAKYILAGGIVFNILEVCRFMYFKQIINFDLLFNPKYVTQIKFDIRIELSFLIFAALIYLLSYIFRYGQELQQLSDETL